MTATASCFSGPLLTLYPAIAGSAMPGKSLSPANRDTKGQSFDRHASPKRDIHSEFQSPTQTGGPICFKGGSKRSWLKKSHNLLELCRYVVLNPVRVKGGTKTAAWKWSSYRATAGLASSPEFLSTDSLLEQFGKNRRVAQKRYREFVRDGITNRPWDELKGQIYLGSDKFIERRSAEDKELKEIPLERSYTHSSRHWNGFLRETGKPGSAGHTESMVIGCKRSPRTWESITRR